VPQARRNGVPIAPILAVNFVATLGFSIVLPFLVYLVTRLGGNALVYGVMGATYSAFQLVGAPVLGRWSDRYGRRRILLLSQVGTAASWGLFLVALALPETPLLDVRSGMLGVFTITLPLVVLFAARALDGITGANASVANAYLADITSEDERAANFGQLAISGNLGFIVGPALAGVLGASPWPEAAPVTGAFLISIAACFVISFGLSETSPCDRSEIPRRAAAPRAMGQEPKDCFEGTGPRKRPVAAVFRIPFVPRLLTLHFFVFLAFNIFYVAFPVYVAQDLDWALAATGTFFAVLSLMMVLVQGPVLRWAGRRWTERPLVLAGSALLALSFPLFGSSSAAWIYTGAALLALGNGVMWPSLLALLSKAAGDEVQGAVQGVAGSSAALASIAGLVVGGVLFGELGTQVFYLAAALTTFVFLAALGLSPTAGGRARISA